MKCNELVNIDSKIGKELQILVDHYSRTHIRNEVKPTPKDEIDFDKYI